MFAGGTTCMETKTGYGLTVQTRHGWPATARRRASTRSPFWVRTSSRRSSRTTPTGTSTWSADRCWTRLRPHVGWIDVFCEEGAFDEAQIAAGAGRRDPEEPRVAGARQSARARAGRQNRGRPRCGIGRPLHLPDRPGHRCARSARARWRPCCPPATCRPGSPRRRPARWSMPGARIALASNCNPGSSYTSSMNLVVALACCCAG